MFEDEAKQILGYQISQSVVDLSDIKVQINNAGDPFKDSYYKMVSHEDEKFVIDWFGKLFKVDDPWGYCTTGSSESILCSLWLARKRFPNAKIYASHDSHFCVKKCADILSMEYVPIQTIGGCMNMDILNKKIEEESVVVLTLGTTINGAYDSISEFHEKIKIKNYHLHLDAAFGGMVYPFIKKYWLEYPFDTINISFHKFIGCPIPSSLFMIRNSLKESISKGNCAGAYGTEMVCIPEKDFCISCSRSGIPAIFMKRYLSSFDKAGHTNELRRLFELKDYLMKELRHHAAKSYEMSLSVSFTVPIKYDFTKNKYSLTRHYGDTHIYLCKHVTKELLDSFIDEIN
jgi:histidine decarboxylase